jgi:4-phosphopantoate--beta-alanine ligase
MVPVVDTIARSLPNVTDHARELADADPAELDAIVEAFDADAALEAVERAIRGQE